jgi:hypothetical protein
MTYSLYIYKVLKQVQTPIHSHISYGPHNPHLYNIFESLESLVSRLHLNIN